MRLTTLLRPSGGLGRSNIYRVAALKTRLCSQQTAAATRPLSTTISTKPEAVGAPLSGGAPLNGGAGTNADPVAASFASYDTDNSGYLDYQELRSALSHMGIDTSSEGVAHLLAAYDERPDGKMDIGEFRKLAQDMEARLATKPETGLIISDLGLASLVPEWRRMFDKSTVVTDVTAGVTVGCVAVPLSLAIALASGVPPEVGLASAAVAGVVGGLMGGTTLAITGPAAAISLLVCEAVQTHGLGTLPFITLACGGLQLATGVVRGGGVAKYVPESVIAGFTTGIGVMILAGQLPKALDLTVPAGLNTVEVVSAVVSGLGSASPAACALALGVVATMQLSPLIHPKIPSALVAVGGATAVTQFGGLSATTIGALPSGLDAFTLCMPVVPSLEALPSLGGTIMIIYALTSAESLLSCTALDKLRPTSYKHNPDQELIGQGLANMTAAAFAGMPVTAVIARSSLNIKLKAHSRLPALVQSAFVFGSLALYSDVISTVPVSALAGAPPSRALCTPHHHTPPFPTADHSHPANPYLYRRAHLVGRRDAQAARARELPRRGQIQHRAVPRHHRRDADDGDGRGHPPRLRDVGRQVRRAPPDPPRQGATPPRGAEAEGGLSVK